MSNTQLSRLQVGLILLASTIFLPSLIYADDIGRERLTVQSGTVNSFTATARSSVPMGDIIFQTGAGEEVLRFKPGGAVIANPKLKPDVAAQAVLSAMYKLAPAYFCRNPDDPDLKKR